jgi:putative sterol carrier protein
MHDPWTDSRGTKLAEATVKAPPTKRCQWLEGVHGTLRFLVGQTHVATLIINEGAARIEEDGGVADTVVLCTSEDDVHRLLRGELNPVIVALLGRMEIEGDVALGIQVLNALRGAMVLPPSES